VRSLSAAYFGGQEALIAPAFDSKALRLKLLEISTEVKEVMAADLEPLFAILNGTDGKERTQDQVRDALSTQIMELFRLHQARSCFGLLYELNGHHLVQQVAARLRRYQSRADARDVLQEVFFNVHRYPHRFNAEREDAFRVWSATIVRNTVLKHLRSQSRGGRAEVPIDDLPEPTEHGVQDPLNGAVDRETTEECNRVYVTYLHLYLRFYSQLSEREQRAIHLVEVEGSSYRDAAVDLGIKLENLKMVIFRARRKIHRSMRRVFDGLPPDVRPARSPKPSSHATKRELATAPACKPGSPAPSIGGRLS
jgi:RNA polymerase sigma-70 factor (ECF subfamily)